MKMKRRQLDYDLKYLQLFTLMLLITCTSAASLTNQDGFTTTNSLDIDGKEYVINLPFSIRLFGDGEFSKLYVNAVGGVSFASGISTSKLDVIKNKAIVFSQLLLMPELKADIQVQYLFTDTEKSTLEEKFKDKIGLVRFDLENAVTVQWTEPEGGNEYLLSIVTDTNERTYVMYEFERVERTKDETMTDNEYARSGIFVMEDGSILCPVELPGSGTSDVKNVTDFHLRVDLPLQCNSFNYSCNEADNTTVVIERKMVAEWQGYFFETVSISDWSFYRLYFCSSRLIKEDGTIAIREFCAYDPDYYMYSWREVTEADRCSVTEPFHIV